MAGLFSKKGLACISVDCKVAKGKFIGGTCEDCKYLDKEECPVKRLQFTPPRFGGKTHNTPLDFGCVMWMAARNGKEEGE